MMIGKQGYYTAIAAAMIAGLASCSSDELVTGGGGDTVVTLTAQLPGGLSRTYGDGTTAETLQYAVYESGKKTPLAVHENGATVGTATFDNRVANVSVTLTQGKSYDFVFWAQAKTEEGKTSPYTFDAATQSVSVDYSDVNANDEALDAFYAHTTITVDGNGKSVELKRPFAQINVCTTDLAAANASGFDATHTTVVVKGASNALDLMQDIASGNETVTFKRAAVANSECTTDKHSQLSMNYVLVGKEGASLDVLHTTHHMDGESEKSKVAGEYASVPLKANYKTHIYGALLTNPVDYEVKITPAFAGEQDPVRVTSKQSFMDALNNAANDEDGDGTATVILDADVALDEDLVFGSNSASAPRSREGLTYSDLKGVTISLGGKTLTVDGSITLLGDAEVNILDGSLVCGVSGSGISVENTSSLYMNGVELTTNADNLTAAIAVYNQSTVYLKDTKILGTKNIAQGFGTNASGLTASSPSFTMTLDNVEVDVRQTAFFCNNPATVNITNSKFTSAFQAGVLRGGNYTFSGKNYFTLAPEYEAESQADFVFLQKNRRGGYWSSNGNDLPIVPLLVGNHTTDGNYDYPTTINIPDGANVYVAVNGKDAECKKFPNALFAANQTEGHGVYFTNNLPEVDNSVSSLYFVYATNNIFVNGNEHYVYDPATVEGWTPTASNGTPSIEINSVGNLRAMAAEVNSGNTMSKWNVALKADLDLENKSWTPIGNASYAFQGVFDGENHTVSNLYINAPKTNYIGLFGNTNSGEVKNLTVHNATLKGRLFVGTVSGHPYTSKYNNITVTGDVKIDAMSYVGGILGKNLYVSSSNLTVNVNKGSYVSVNSIENGTEYRSYVGGVVGFMGEGKIVVSNATSNIDVIGTTCDVGGITGIAHYNNTFENCSSSGNIKVTYAYPGKEYEVGGIAGVWHNENGTKVIFNNCSFTGTLSSVRDGNTFDVSGNTITGCKYSADGTGELYIDGVLQNN